MNPLLQCTRKGGVAIVAEPIEIVDVEDALKRADEYAELTGRSKADIIADLLDDGQLNMSAGADIEPEKDILDIAQEKAEKLKTLLITLAPMIALLSGVGLEGLGILDFTDWGEDSVWEDAPPDEHIPHSVLWGCTDPAANNYDQWATDDDGSCSYDNTQNRNLDIQNAHLSLVGDNELKVEFNLQVEGDFCCDDIELVWEIEVNGFYDDGLRRVTHHSYDEEGYIGLEQYWPNMDEGNYHARVEVRWMNDRWDEDTTNGVTIEAPPVQGCTDPEATNYDASAEEDDGSCEYPAEEEWADIKNFDSLKDGDDGIELTIQIDFNDDAEWNEDLRLRWTLWLDDESIPTEEVEEYIDVRDPENEWLEHHWTGLEAGDWIPKVQAYYGEELLDEETFDTITIEDPEPPECTVAFYAYQLSWSDSNNTSLTAYSDPDELTCGETVTVDVFFEITWKSNGTVVWDALNTTNITGESWEDIMFNSPTLANGTYSATLELYIVVDGERAAEASETRVWSSIEVGDGEA